MSLFDPKYSADSSSYLYQLNAQPIQNVIKAKPVSPENPDLHAIKTVEVKKKRKRAETTTITKKQRFLQKEERVRRLQVNREESNARTIFVSNIPVKDLAPGQLRQAFSKYGKVETLRLRSIGWKNPKKKQRIGVRTKVHAKLIHPDRPTCNAYIVFRDPESVPRALEHNGNLFKKHHLIVDRADGGKLKNKYTVYCTRLPKKISEEQLWQFFSENGVSDIKALRIIRSRRTSLGLGFGFVQFQSSKSCHKAIQLSGQVLDGSMIRISKARNQDWKFQGLKKKLLFRPDEDDEDKTKNDRKRSKRPEEGPVTQGPQGKAIKKKKLVPDVLAKANVTPWQGLRHDDPRGMPKAKPKFFNRRKEAGKPLIKDEFRRAVVEYKSEQRKKVQNQKIKRKLDAKKQQQKAREKKARAQQGNVMEFGGGDKGYGERRSGGRRKGGGDDDGGGGGGFDDEF